MAYSLPNEVFLLLEDAFHHDRTKAQMFAKAIEDSIQAIETQAEQHISDKKETLRSDPYNELHTELTTKEFVRAKIGTLRPELKQNSLLLKIQIGLIIFGLTLFNPAFVKLVELIMK